MYQFSVTLDELENLNYFPKLSEIRKLINQRNQENYGTNYTKVCTSITEPRNLNA